LCRSDARTRATSNSEEEDSMRHAWKLFLIAPLMLAACAVELPGGGDDNVGTIAAGQQRCSDDELDQFATCVNEAQGNCGRLITTFDGECEICILESLPRGVDHVLDVCSVVVVPPPPREPPPRREPDPNPNPPFEHTCAEGELGPLAECINAFCPDGRQFCPSRNCGGLLGALIGSCQECVIETLSDGVEATVELCEPLEE
jgi:hypothetical protein